MRFAYLGSDLERENPSESECKRAIRRPAARILEVYFGLSSEQRFWSSDRNRGGGCDAWRNGITGDRDRGIGQCVCIELPRAT